MSANDILLVEQKGYVGTLTLNRHHKRDSLTPQLLIRLRETLTEIRRTDDIRRIVIRSAGSHAFSAGYNISALGTAGPPPVISKSNT